MLHPSYIDLMKVVNADVKPGEPNIAESRYTIVMATAKRARQIVSGSDPMVPIEDGKKPLSYAVEELYEGKIKILPESAEDGELLLQLEEDTTE